MQPRAWLRRTGGGAHLSAAAALRAAGRPSDRVRTAGRSRTGGRPCRRRYRGTPRARRPRPPARRGGHRWSGGHARNRPPPRRDAVHPVVQPLRIAIRPHPPGDLAEHRAATAPGPASARRHRAAADAQHAADASRHGRRAGRPAAARPAPRRSRRWRAAPAPPHPVPPASCASVRPRPSAAKCTRWPSRARRSLWSWLPSRKRPRPRIQQAEHQPQHRRAVRPVVGQVAELQQEQPLGLGPGDGMGEGHRIAMHVADHAQPGEAAAAQVGGGGIGHAAGSGRVAQRGEGRQRPRAARGMVDHRPRVVAAEHERRRRAAPRPAPPRARCSHLSGSAASSGTKRRT